MAVNPIPEGHGRVTPSIVVAGAAKAIEWYRRALGAEEVSRFEGPDGRIMHAEIKIGDSYIMMGDEMPDYGARGPGLLGGTPVSFFLYGPEVDKAWQRAVDAGAKVVMPLTDQFWGDRSGCIADPFGHQWWISQRVKNMTQEELRKAADAMFSQPAGK
ncbi:MAG TPA: VOC family protein [Gemmatimonadales bacterium]|jgi:PhnB protein|nr:VOC family protein [Gemmatimonadales bacterium]